MLRKLIYLIILFPTLSVAQSTSPIQFEAYEHNFGTVLEENGPLLYEFVFKNTGEKPVTITDVKASCGCTTPAWSKEAVAPGEEGFVQAQYNPYNRPGSFHKNLTVYTDAGGEPVKLYIKGLVQPAAKSVEEVLTEQLGYLKVKYTSLNMGKVLTTAEPTEKSFDLYNSGKEDMIFRKALKPAYVEVTFPDTLKPGQLGRLEVKYYGDKKGDLGFFTDNLTLITSEEDSIKSFTLFANVEEYFPPMTEEQFSTIPKISFGEQVYDFDRVKQGEQVKASFEFKNNGRSTLNIRKIDSNCSCVEAQLLKNDLSPGESAIIEFIFDTSNRRGNQQKALTIYSNDPSSPVERLTIKGYIETDEN